MVNMTSYGSINSDASGHDEINDNEHIDYTEPIPSSYQMDKMRTRLRFYFMNPVDKWHTRKLFPYKLAVQVIKILFVTFQVI